MVVEVARRGKLVVGELYFTAGTPLLLDRKGLGDAGPGDLVVARRTRGRAKVERVLGPADRVENVLEALLVETGARQEFEPYTPPDITFEGRVDLRELTTLTIDPETAKDFDDALSIDDDRAYVHIADVSYFVDAGSPLDRGASERGFSTYVPGLVAPMLPPELADDLCSLRPHVARPCVTVELPLNDGEPSFYRSVIRSDARLSYGQAQRILSGSESFAHTDVLRPLDERARELRRRRFARGALRIQTPEVVFDFDGRGGVAGAHREGEPEAHALVEEFMIAANEAVAGLLASRNRAALYRVHERPEPQSVQLLLAKLAELEVPTPPVPEQLTPSSAEAVAAAAAEQVATYVEQSGRGRDAFPALVLRALKQARYDPRNLGHSGLASRAYSHFTSPIRRYADLVCHRALLRELGVGDDALPDELTELAEQVSAREREAAQVEYLADEICLAWLLDSVLFEKGWEAEFGGEIVGVIGSGLFIRFDDVFEAFLPARRLPGDYFEASPLGTALTGRRGGGTFRLGDSIDVRVERIERSSGRVEVAPV
ncbi:MAG TPA: RNB domain-containing ribonuclease [Gaiellaceae bacterium]